MTGKQPVLRRRIDHTNLQVTERSVLRAAAAEGSTRGARYSSPGGGPEARPTRRTAEAAMTGPAERHSGKGIVPPSVSKCRVRLPPAAWAVKNQAEGIGSSAFDAGRVPVPTCSGGELRRGSGRGAGARSLAR
jgi:hypothetical protein